MKHHDIKKAGLRATGPRIRILEILETNEKRHLAAEDIFRILDASGESVGLATIYRVLTQFESAGILQRSNFDNERSVFELTPENHHDHIVCTDSGEVIEFSDELIEKRQKAICVEKGFELVDHNLVLYVRKKDL